MYPILFRFGPIAIYSYGASIAIAFIITSYFIIKESEGFGIPKEDMWNLLFLILISGIIGARLLCIFLNFRYYKGALLEMVMLHKGGLAIHGAIIAAISISLLFLLKRDLPLWKTGDLIMQYMPLGQAIGRIGCLLNGCCYGKPTDFFGITFPKDSLPRHPTQIYSSLALLMLFIVLKYLNKIKRFDGQIFLIYFLIYSPLRFFLDFLRGDLSMVFFGLTASQLISAILFFAVLTIYYFKSSYKGDYTDFKKDYTDFRR